MKTTKEKLRALSSSITQCDDDTRLLHCGIMTGLLGVIVAISIHVEMGNFFLFPLVVNAFCMGLAAALVGYGERGGRERIDVAETFAFVCVCACHCLFTKQR